MADVRRFLGDHKLGMSVVAASLLVVGGVAAAGAGVSDDGTATVTGIVDGDTIDVEVDGEEQRVRLLNVDTPEVDQCVHAEATAFLAERVPPGTEVVLELDEEHHDQYGRLLAGVHQDGSLVNAEIARAGLGVAVLVEPNDRFYDDVLEAQQAAEAEGLGLFSQGVSCTLPAQVRTYAEQVEDLEAHVSTAGTLEEIDGWAAEAAVAAATGAALAEVLDGDDDTFPLLAYSGKRWTLHQDAASLDARRVAAEETIAAARTAEEDRLREEEERREREEQERREREEAERLAREEAERVAREEAERLAREEAERQEAERQQREAAERRAAEEAAQPSTGGGGSAYYKNCSAARAAGAAPVYAGEPGYGRHLDRDGDGIGCE